MIVISIKKIISIIGIAIMCIFAYTITNINMKNALIKDNKSIATVALPVDKKVIIIDAGHGVPDEGAESSARNNRSRKQFKNSTKSTKFIRTIRSNSSIN